MKQKEWKLEKKMEKIFDLNARWYSMILCERLTSPGSSSAVTMCFRRDIIGVTFAFSSWFTYFEFAFAVSVRLRAVTIASFGLSEPTFVNNDKSLCIRLGNISNV